MPDNFQQTVDLREQVERQRRRTQPKKTPAPIEELYRSEEAGEPFNEMKKINRPAARERQAGWFKLVVFFLAIVVVVLTVYFLFFSRPATIKSDLKSANWYAVKLVDGTIYYGQVFDVKAEPITVSKVYYNYDQAKSAGAAKEGAKTIEETGNIRLVKRGKETQGGDGSMLLYHVNILLMEALRGDSKVLSAILEYEK